MTLIYLSILSVLFSTFLAGKIPEPHQFNNIDFVSQDELLVFDRNHMIEGKEGYWASSPDPLKDIYKGKYPFPKANIKPWPGQAQFLEKLLAIEQKAQCENEDDSSNNFPIKIIQYKGFALSRLDASNVGSQEFIGGNFFKSIRWPEGFSTHYIGKYNVKPCREFYDYIMSFDLKYLS